MVTILVRDIDWARYGIPDPAASADDPVFTENVGSGSARLRVTTDTRYGGRRHGVLSFMWRGGMTISLEQAQRLVDEVFTHPFYRRNRVYADQLGYERVFELPPHNADEYESDGWVPGVSQV